MVYVRFNLRNADMYIGETVSFNTRFQAHTRKTWKHYTGKCKCCAEHHSYTRQGLMHPGEWVMMPLVFTNAMSLKRCEKFYIRKFQSSLNKEIYAKGRQWNHAHRRQETRPKNTKQRRPRPKTTNTGQQVTATTYKLQSDHDFSSPSLNTVMQT